MSGILQVLNFINPRPPAPPPLDYDGLEYKWKMFTIRPAYFKTEALAFSALAVYILLYLAGQYLSTARAKATLKPIQSFINTQFTRSRDLLASGPAQHLYYSTGRRNALCLHTTIFLYPIHDIVSLLIHIGQSIIEPTYDGSESVLFNLTLGIGSEGKQGEGLGVWAVADKGAMGSLREKRWDLENPSVPITHALFTEHSEVNDVLFKTANIGVAELLKDSTAANVLKYLVPASKPAKGALNPKLRKREIILSVKKPSGKAQEDAVKAWLQVILNIADLVAKPNLLKPEIARKLVKTRDQLDAELSAEYAKDRREESGELSKEEQAEEKRLAKKKAERATMSDKELKKLAELEKKREMRKMQKKGGKAQ